MTTNQRIFLAAQPNYDEAALAGKLHGLLEPATAGSNLRGTQVLLKPNLLTANNAQLACTDARFLVAAARWFLDQGAKVQVGDSPHPLAQPRGCSGPWARLTLLRPWGYAWRNSK